MEANVKRFETELNYDEVRRSLAEALAVLQETPEKKKIATAVVDNPVSELHTAKVLELDTQPLSTTRQKAKRKTVSLGYIAASLFAGVLISGAAAMLSTSARHT